MDDILHLNVGGRPFVTTRATLCAEEGSILAHRFDPESKFAPPADLTFIDRDPTTFEFVLKYLRHGRRLVSDVPDDLVGFLQEDADYFGLLGLKEACESHILQKKNEAIRKKNEADTARARKTIVVIDAADIDMYIGASGGFGGWQLEASIPDRVAGDKNQRYARVILSVMDH